MVASEGNYAAVDNEIFRADAVAVTDRTWTSTFID
jgi:hypothetical protein